MVLICDILGLGESGHVTEQLQQQVLAYGAKEEDYGPNMAFYVCSRPKLRNDYKVPEKEVVESRLGAEETAHLVETFPHSQQLNTFWYDTGREKQVW